MKRGLGRGRILVGIGSLVTLVGMALPWITVGGGAAALPVTTQNGFDGAGILVFIGAILTLALLTLPYASRTGSSSLDGRWSYLALAGMGVVALAAQAVGFFGRGQLQLPDRAPGLWVAGFGLFVVCWGVSEILGERPPLS